MSHHDHFLRCIKALLLSTLRLGLCRKTCTEKTAAFEGSQGGYECKYPLSVNWSLAILELPRLDRVDIYPRVWCGIRKCPAGSQVILYTPFLAKVFAVCPLDWHDWAAWLVQGKQSALEEFSCVLCTFSYFLKCFLIRSQKPGDLHKGSQRVHGRGLF